MQQRRIGDRTVSAIGLGGMPMSVRPTNDEEQGIATIRAAVENGVTLIDTADAYCQGESDFGHNEVLIAKALDGVGRGRRAGRDQGRPHPDRRRLEPERPARVPAHRPRARRRSGSASSRSGSTSSTGPTRPSPTRTASAASRTLLDDGLIARAGISNADPAQIRQAHEILGDGLVSVQNQYSPSFRSSEPEIDVCDELGLAFLPWSPLGGMRGAGGPRRRLRRVRQGRGQARRQPAAGGPRLGAGPLRQRHPDPRRQPAGVGRGLDGRRPPASRRRGPGQRCPPRSRRQRRTNQKVSPSRTTETSTNQPSSIHWNGQYRLSGW